MEYGWTLVHMGGRTAVITEYRGKQQKESERQRGRAGGGIHSDQKNEKKAKKGEIEV